MAIKKYRVFCEQTRQISARRLPLRAVRRAANLIFYSCRWQLYYDSWKGDRRHRRWWKRGRYRSELHVNCACDLPLPSITPLIRLAYGEPPSPEGKALKAQFTRYSHYTPRLCALQGKRYLFDSQFPLRYNKGSAAEESGAAENKTYGEIP